MVALNADTDHVIDWYHAARGGRGRESSTGAVIAYQPGVQDAVGDKARSLASAAWLQLAWHRRTGAHANRLMAANGGSDADPLARGGVLMSRPERAPELREHQVSSG